MRYAVSIKPNSRKGPYVDVQPDGSLVVFVREPAIDGKANQALVLLLAKHFDVAKTRIEIVHGYTLKSKIVDIEGA